MPTNDRRGRVSPVDVVATLRADRAPLVFLDGGLDADGLGRWSAIATDAIGAVFAWGTNILHVESDGRCRRERGDPIEALWRRTRSLDNAIIGGRGQSAPPLGAGAFGWMGYEVGRTIERLPAPADDTARVPDLAFWLFPEVLVYDADEGRWHGGSPRQRRALEECRPTCTTASPVGDAHSDFARREYEETVDALLEHIAAGDVYQVNLSQRFHGALVEDPFMVYRRLRARHPAPLGAYIEAGARAVLSNSPELFVRTRGRSIETRPIKGTRPRGETAATDARLRDELLTSAKDAAELTMIVDLMRNDLGKLATTGSVAVLGSRRCVTLPTVHHLVATVSAELRSDVSPAEVLRATFPAGSISGCPKVRAMQLIADLEPCRRGVYTGAIGWLGASGEMTMNVAIRTLTVDHRRWTFHAGGGIVADSVAALEYDETLAKSAAFADALGIQLGDAD